MNIDVREYLRINPISVHELTLSGDGKDCFLYFPADGQNPKTGFEVHTQNAIFLSLYKSIFQDLITNDIKFKAEVNYTEDGPEITWGRNIHLTDSQFKNYVRNHLCPGSHFQYIWDDSTPNGNKFTGFKNNFDKEIRELEEEIDGRIFDLKMRAKLNYIGAVEIHTTKIKNENWKVPVWSNDIEENWPDIRNGWANAQQIYSDFGYSNGQIWCTEAGKRTQTGYDKVGLGNVPLKHNHMDTKAETMTTSFTKNRGGAALVGKFGIGSNQLVGQDSTHHISGTNLSMVSGNAGADGSLTYPLYGQNVINARTRNRTHNNVPPCTYTHVRYFGNNGNVAQTQSLMEVTMSARDVEPEENKKTSFAEATYESILVPDLEDYTKSDMTTHDFLLRMVVGDCACNDCDCSNVKMMKQTVQMLLDIFSEDAFNRLGVPVKYEESKPISEFVEVNGRYEKNLKYMVTISQILEIILDRELVRIDEFVTWFNTQMKVLQRIYGKIILLKDLLKSMKPMTYTGRVIMSTTDDTERKVIEHYGGVHWRRITNFIRGVPQDNKEWGAKTGEEYVCLRESDIPIHTHDVHVENRNTTGSAEWLVAGQGGTETKVLNGTSGEAVGGVKNVNLEYQISPLEYEERDSVTLPHDNMPPFREVYIWECVETSAEEQMVSGEPPANKFTIYWNTTNGGNAISPWTGFIEGSKVTDPPGQPELPVPVKQGYDFVDWRDEYGNLVTERFIVTRTETFTAQWRKKKFTVRFHANGGTFGGRTLIEKTYEYDDPIGKFPNATRSSSDWSDVTLLDKWTASATGGTEITASTKVKGAMDVYAQWKRYVMYYNIGGVTLDENNVASGFADDKCLQTLQKLNFQNTFTIVMKFTTGDSFTTPTGGPMEQQLFSTSNDIEVAVSDNKNNGTGIPKMCWEIACPWGETGGWATAKPWGALTVQPNTTYWMKVVKERYVSPGENNIFCYVKKENENWPETPDYQGSRDATTNNPIWFGVDNDGYFHSYWRGSIYMDESYIINEGIYYYLIPSDEIEITFNANGGSPETTTKTLKKGDAIGEIPYVYRTGYSLNGWWTAASGGTQIGAGTTVNGSATFYAHWTGKNCTIMWDPNNRQSMIVDTKMYGDALTPPAVENPGYSIAGWFTEVEGGTQLPSGATVTGDAIYHAHWTANTYTVTYDTQGGNALSPSSKQVTFGNPYGTLPTPTKNGHTFNGWFTQPSGGSQVKAETIVSTPSNHTIYARWSANNYTITWNSNGGQAVASWTRPYGSKLGTLPTPTFTGKVLVGWFTQLEGGSQIGPTTEVLGNATYYARWTAVYVLTFSLNQSSYKYSNPKWPDGTTKDKYTTIKPNQKYPANPSSAPNLPTDAGYNFAQWRIQGGDVIPNPASNYVFSFQENKTLLAQWTAKKFQLTLHLNNRGSSYLDLSTAKWSDNTQDNKQYAVTFAQKYPSFPTSSAVGWTFTRWYNQTTSSYFDNGKYQLTDTDYSIASNSDLWAQWRRNRYTVRYNGNGHTSGTTPDSTHEYGIAKTLSTNGFQKVYTVTFNANGGTTPDAQSASCSFAGWATSSGGSVAYGNMASVTNLTDVDGAIVNLYAKWDSGTVTLPETSWEGRDLAGWFTSASGGTKAGTPGQTYTISSATTLYAQWTVPLFSQTGTLFNLTTDDNHSYASRVFSNVPAGNFRITISNFYAKHDGSHAHHRLDVHFNRSNAGDTTHFPDPVHRMYSPWMTGFTDLTLSNASMWEQYANGAKNYNNTGTLTSGTKNPWISYMDSDDNDYPKQRDNVYLTCDISLSAASDIWIWINVSNIPGYDAPNDCEGGVLGCYTTTSIQIEQLA